MAVPDVISVGLSLDAWGPLPRWISMVHLPVSSHRIIGLPPVRTRSAFPRHPAQRLQYRALISGLQSFLYVQASSFARHPGRSYRYDSIVGNCDFYIRAYHGLLPPRAPDMLTVRTGQLTVEDFHLIKSTALSAAPITVWLSGSGGDRETSLVNPLLTLHFAPAFPSGEAAVRCSRC